MSRRTIVNLAIRGTALACVVLTGTGCPFEVLTPYNRGFNEGFAQDDWYWQGFDDSYATVYGSPIYYQGSEIQYVETPEYDRGYWDGVWYAYNDGYFVCYDYAFTVGFSEGYDTAFYEGYLQFLANDHHVEYGNGGWDDGYNDGFSEGRVFGANDYEQGLEFDWLDALLDYRSGTDLYFEEIDLGTGVYGPVILYEYGTDPAAEKSPAPARPPRDMPTPAIRTALPLKGNIPPPLSYRTLPATVEENFDKLPLNTDRSAIPLNLTTTWLERINAYRSAVKAPAKALRAHAASETAAP